MLFQGLSWSSRFHQPWENKRAEVLLSHEEYLQYEFMHCTAVTFIQTTPILIFLKGTEHKDWAAKLLAGKILLDFSSVDWFVNLQIFCLFQFSNEASSWYLSIFITSYSQTSCRIAASPLVDVRVLQKWLLWRSQRVFSQLPAYVETLHAHCVTLLLGSSTRRSQIESGISSMEKEFFGRNLRN